MVHGGIQAMVMLFLCLIYGGPRSRASFSLQRSRRSSFSEMVFMIIMLFVALSL
jgi:hypothetical protein